MRIQAHARTTGLLALVALAACVDDAQTPTASPLQNGGGASYTSHLGAGYLAGFGTAPTRPYAINEAGWIAGTADSMVSGSTRRRAVRWSPTGEIESLGTLGGTHSDAFDINEVGWIVGKSTNLQGQIHAFLWIPGGAMQDLGTLGGHLSTAGDINDNGMVIGSSTVPTTLDDHAFAWTAGTGMVDLGTLGGADSYASAVNNAGQVVGYAFTSEGTGFFHNAFLWTAGGGMQDLGRLPGGYRSAATAINSSGVVVGWSYTVRHSEKRAFRWTPEGGMESLGSLGGESEAIAINDDGTIVGTSYTGNGGQRRAFRWTPEGGMEDLGSVGTGPFASSVAVDVNEAGYVIGQTSADAGSPNAFLWHPQYGMQDLYATEAYDINDAGQVLGGTPGALLLETSEVIHSPPVARIDAPATGIEGVAVPFVSESHNWGRPTTLTYAWRFGDGSSSSAASPTKTYNDQGTYEIWHRVRTSAGGMDTAYATITISNRAPTGVFRVPTRLEEGTAFTLSVGNVSDSRADLTAGIQFAFDCGTGAFGAWQASASKACPAIVDDDGPATMRVMLRDKDGGETTYSTPVPVSNARPVVSLNASSTSVANGGSVTFTGSFTDKGASDSPWQYVLRFGDGTAALTGTLTPGTPLVVPHTYTRTGTWTAYLTVTDNDGLTGVSQRIAVTVAP